MTYWFVPPHAPAASAPEPPHVTIRYSSTQHQATQRNLARLLTNLTQWIADYQQGTLSPQVPVGDALCLPCSFTPRCDRPSANDLDSGEGFSAKDASIPSIDEIDEIAL
jgi:hypothetical protein